MASYDDLFTIRYSGDLRVDSLLDDATLSWNFILPARTTLYYTFDTSLSSGRLTGVSAFNPAQKAAAQALMAYTANVTGIAFAEVSTASAADFHFSNGNIVDPSLAGETKTTWNYLYDASRIITSYTAEAFIYLDNAEWASSNVAPAAGNRAYELLLHEVGHALGLDHPFDTRYELPADQDNTGNTVMSYTHVGPFKTTFQSYDLLALQWIYGADGLRGSSGYNSLNGSSLRPTAPPDDYPASSATTAVLTPGTALTGVLEAADDRDWFAVSLSAGTRYVFELQGAANGQGTLADPWLWLLGSGGATLASNDDAGGSLNAKIEYTATTSGVFYLQAMSSVVGGLGTYRLSAAGSVADLVGGTGDDTLVDTGGASRLSGLAGDDRLQAGAGNDVVDGGTGTDTAVYTQPAGTYRVAVAAAGWSVTDKAGRDGVDTLVGVERLEFADKGFDLVRPATIGTPAYGVLDHFLFDPVYYLLEYPSLVPANTLATAWSAYAGAGAARHERPNSWFDASYYANRWSDLGALNLDDASLFRHFNLYGVWEGRSPGPVFDRFDPSAYLSANPDVAAYIDDHLPDFLNSRANGAIAHYILYGAAEGRAAVDLSGQPIRLDYAIDLGT